MGRDGKKVGANFGRRLADTLDRVEGGVSVGSGGRLCAIRLLHGREHVVVAFRQRSNICPRALSLARAHELFEQPRPIGVQGSDTMHVDREVFDLEQWRDVVDRALELRRMGCRPTSRSDTERVGAGHDRQRRICGHDNRSVRRRPRRLAVSNHRKDGSN